MATHLTERVVKAAEIGTRKYVVFDEDCAGFGLCVFLSGRKGFILIYRAAGRQRRMTIGTWPSWSPQHPQTNGMVERFNGRIEEVLQSHHFRSGEELETTLHRYVALYNQQLPQSALGSKTPLQAMKDWHKLKPELFG